MSQTSPKPLIAPKPSTQNPEPGTLWNLNPGRLQRVCGRVWKASGLSRCRSVRAQQERVSPSGCDRGVQTFGGSGWCIWRPGGLGFWFHGLLCSGTYDLCLCIIIEDVRGYCYACIATLCIFGVDYMHCFRRTRDLGLIHTYICICVYVCRHVGVYAYIGMYVCMYVCIYIGITPCRCVCADIVCVCMCVRNPCLYHVFLILLWCRNYMWLHRGIFGCMGRRACTCRDTHTNTYMYIYM